jgi:hypothetical protein
MTNFKINKQTIIVSLITLAVGVVIASIYWYFNPKVEIKEIPVEKIVEKEMVKEVKTYVLPEPLNTETKDWKVYQSDYGFSFRYPEDLVDITFTDNSQSYKSTSPKEFDTKSVGSVSIHPKVKDPRYWEGPMLDITVIQKYYKNDEYFSVYGGHNVVKDSLEVISKYMGDTYKRLSKEGSGIMSEEYHNSSYFGVDNVYAFTYEPFSSERDSGKRDAAIRQMYFEKSGNRYLLYYSPEDPLIDKIFNTFVFD